MWNQGKSYREVGKLVDKSHTTVMRFIEKFHLTNDIKRRVGSGRKKKTTRRTDMLIVRTAKKNPFITAGEIKRQLSLNITERTIRNHLGSAGLKRYIAQKPWINAVNRAKRIKWAREHVNWTRRQWSKVLWSDESPFVLRQNRKMHVWRFPNQRYKPENMQGTVKYQQKLMGDALALRVLEDYIRLKEE